MGKRMRWDVLVRFLLALALGVAGVASPRLVGVAYAMQIAAFPITTTVADTVYHADGTAAAGTLIINWPTFTTMGGEVIQGGSQSTTIGAGGALHVSLVPNVGATPIGTYYTVVYHLDDGSVQKEYWVIPVSTASVTIATVKNTVLPTSVAMQTVSKSYVDMAIAAAVTGTPLDTSPYVVKAGDAMTGPLVLPADPVSANQAADKHYVDATIASIGGSVGGKVALLPGVTQVVTQPAGTDLETNRMNGTAYASQYATIPNSNGVENAATSADCASAGAAGLGCVVTVEPTVNGTETYTSKAGWGDQTHIQDMRQGSQHDIYLNPKSTLTPWDEVGHAIDVTTTYSIQADSVTNRREGIQATGQSITLNGLAGGSNLFAEDLGSVPYFKSGYTAQSLTGNYNTPGQHILQGMTTNCFSVGDCLIGAQYLYSMGGYRDSADEGTHPYDIDVLEDPRVFTGTCATGCTTGSQSVTVGSQTYGGTQGDGRYLIDTNPVKGMTTGLLTGGSAGTIHPTATFSGTTFPVSTFFQTATLIPSQTHNIAPGTVTVAIATAGVPAGFSTNTAAAPSSSGVACIASESSILPNHEMVPYTIVDGTHLQVTLLKPHGAGATIAIGGLCGYGLEQTVDTVNGIRQLFPVVGSYSSTGLYYAGSQTYVVGQMNTTSAYTNVNLPIVSAVRSGNVVTVTVGSTAAYDLNGLTMMVAGATDSSYNGSFPVTTTSATTLTYAETGPNSSTAGGTISYVTGGYALYPMAEVLSVYNAATKTVDGTFTLGANTVAWAAGDTMEQPHYFQTKIAGDTTIMRQTVPRPRNYQSLGYFYDGNNGPGLRGFAIQNATPASSYFGNGGTHGYPDIAYESLGIWKRTFDGQAGEQSVFSIHCNSKGCNRWNSGYDLFELDSSAGIDLVNYAPQTSVWTMNLRGTPYSFSPLAFTAGTANITTLNVTTLNAGTISMGAVSASSVTSSGAVTGSSLTTGTITATSETLTGTSTSAAVNTGVVTATTLNGALDASNVASGTLSAARLPVMGASGTAHAVGAVPDPGATAGTARYLREDGTWVSPAGGVTSFNSRIGAIAPVSGDYGVAQVTGAAALASPALTGVPTAPTATAGTNTTQLATTAFGTAAVAAEATLRASADALLAPLASPALTGTPTAPTATTGDSSTKVATTAFVSGAVSPVLAAANTALAAVPALPSAGSMLFDYRMPGSDAGNAYFTDYSTSEGSTVGVGNCPFLSGHAPVPLANGGAVFSSTTAATATGCTVPGAAGLRTFVAMVAPTTITASTSQPGNVLLGGSSASNLGPFLLMKTASNLTGYAMGMLQNGAYTTASQDVSAGLSCVSYNVGTSGDSTYDMLGINGAVVGSYLSTPGRTPALSSGSWLLGDSGLSGYYYAGTMYRAVGWNTYLTQGQVAQACQLLQQDAASKGAVNPLTAANTSTTPTLSCVGDSIQSTTGGPAPCTLLTGVPTTTVSVYAIPGAIVNDAIGQVPTREVAGCSTAATNYAVIESSTNDLANGISPAVVWANVVRYATTLRAGWDRKGCHGKIFVQTPGSRYQIDNGNANFVPSVNVTNGGSGYTSLPTVTYSGTCGTLPTTLSNTTYIALSNGAVSIIAPTTFGLGCSAVTVSITGGGGSGATATVNYSVAGNGSRDTYVALAEANALASGFDAVIDVAKDAALGCNFCFLNPAYYNNDFIHPNTAGKQAIANDYSAMYVYQSGSPYVQPKAVTAAAYAMGFGDGYLTTLGTATNQAFTLPLCSGLMGATYKIENPQSAYAATVVGASTSQTILGLTSALTIPGNSMMTLRAISNTGNAGGCHWSY